MKKVSQANSHLPNLSLPVYLSRQHARVLPFFSGVIMGRWSARWAQCCAQSPSSAGRSRHKAARASFVAGEILIGSAIIAISLLYASRTPASRRRSREETKSGWNQTQFRSGLTCRKQRWHRDERNTASRRAVQHRHRSFCIVAICYFVHIHNGVTSHQRVPMHSLVPIAFFSSPGIFLRFPFPRPRIPISGCHPSTSIVDAFRADLLDLKEWLRRNSTGRVTIKMRLMHCERIESLIFTVVNVFKKAHY